MKKTVLRCGALLLLAILLPACLAGALESTAKTRTISMDGAKLIATQDAYFPAGDYCSEAKLSSPEDLYYRTKACSSACVTSSCPAYPGVGFDPDSITPIDAF